MTDLDDLKARLALPLRLTPALENANFTYGFTAATLDKVVRHWRTKYDWKKREARLNTFPHFKTQIEGLDIHFLKAAAKAGPGVTVVPLLLVHGWPGSVVEFYNILPLLTTPQEGSGVAFEVICPSIPGYAFSQASTKQGLGHLETAQIFLKLMKRLGYERFFAQGGDWGSLIVSDMATLYPDNVLGVHVNMLMAHGAGRTLKALLGAWLPAGVLVDAADQGKLYPLGEKMGMLLQESGYMHIQATKPDTIGAALNQQPVSLAVYILEKFSTWTDKHNSRLPDGGLLQPDFPIPLDEMLDNICVYWFTNSITTSMRFYAENFPTFFTRTLNNIPCRVPAGLAAFPQELALDPKNFLAHKYYDIVTYSDQPAGGHFAAMERPRLLASDIHNFVKAVRQRRP
ncbi:Juvenile hormone epoxide hydrolase 1 [Chionoecetes opilio]|uniref:Epoxide hydrolase n=1 Tax=Chionoecetes opilio TaxID=41210 RepID=A0A8J4XP63_CHIOP|nr:Juvenile hormone epoxide hydrolase 1 [Chionoecetes opilio]